MGGAGSASNTVWPGPRPTFVPSGILIHPAIWPQYTWAEIWERPFLGELGLYLTQCCLGRGLPPYQVASWSIQPFGHNTWADNWEGLLCPHVWGGGAGSPSNTVSPGLRPTFVPSFILMHPATLRTDRTDSQGLIAWGELFYKQSPKNC